MTGLSAGISTFNSPTMINKMCLVKRKIKNKKNLVSNQEFNSNKKFHKSFFFSSPQGTLDLLFHSFLFHKTIIITMFSNSFFDFFPLCFFFIFFIFF